MKACERIWRRTNLQKVSTFIQCKAIPLEISLFTKILFKLLPINKVM